MKSTSSQIGTTLMLILLLGSQSAPAMVTGPTAIVDTGQSICYDESVEINCTDEGEPFHGQDAQHHGHQPHFVLSGDELTVDDLVTGLTWQQSPDTDEDGDIDAADKLTWAELQAYPATLNAQSFGGYTDWRLPTIKELYSLIDFRGLDPSGYEGGTEDLVPFIDTDVFAFAYGDESAGERIIDSQYGSSTVYVGDSDLGQLLFGVNFADGRIKGYGMSMPGGLEKTFFATCVRGNTEYGLNDFMDNGDGTVTDQTTGLMWMQDDTGEGMTWEEALAYAEELSLAGHDDWRLPNVKELQSIVDYTRSPSTHGTAAIDPIFSCTSITDEGGNLNFPYYWSGTTHANWSIIAGGAAAYVAFGEGLGWMQSHFPPYDYTLMDVHGAGCQRSDPKIGDPDDWPYGHGPQGDVIRIFNHGRCVRDADPVSAVNDEVPTLRTGLQLKAAPNPFNPSTILSFTLPESGFVTVTIIDAAGRFVNSLIQADLPSGDHEVIWNGRTHLGRTAASGVYMAKLTSQNNTSTLKLALSK